MNPTPIKIQATIFIADENDNTPVFPKTDIQNNDMHNNIGRYENLSIYELNIPESALIGTRYSLPMATDLDSPRYGIKQYQLQLINDQTSNKVITNDKLRTSSYLSQLESPFTLINPLKLISNRANSKSDLGSPQLQVDQQLDREEKSIYYYRLIVQDNGQPPLQSAILLHVKITDVNDNSPRFFNLSTDTTRDTTDTTTTTNNNNIYIMENTTIGSKIYQFHTIDLDADENGNVTYWIDWKSLYGDLNQLNIQSIVSKYTLNPINGELRISNELDYENEYERKIVLLIQAVDNGLPKLTSSLSFTVNLIDINDNEPEIEMLQTQSTDMDISSKSSEIPLLYENDPKSQLLRLLSIKDKDSCSVNKITCQLIDEKENRLNFRLISYSNYAYGLLNQREFDYEKDTNTNGHLLAGIQCQDLAEPPKLIKKWFEIPLGDLNDNWPQFNQTNYEFYIYENVPITHI
ncbi:unnamed protein product [Heterobilharzia americana]|nr:unnamed protein product [Heterobilharzia americana]